MWKLLQEWGSGDKGDGGGEFKYICYSVRTFVNAPIVPPSTII
jgi:hypothetical protein